MPLLRSSFSPPMSATMPLVLGAKQRSRNWWILWELISLTFKLEIIQIDWRKLV
jgi:hypothetical protein